MFALRGPDPSRVGAVLSHELRRAALSVSASVHDDVDDHERSNEVQLGDAG
jgi:hypothetical protein